MADVGGAAQAAESDRGACAAPDAAPAGVCCIRERARQAMLWVCRGALCSIHVTTNDINRCPQVAAACDRWSEHAARRLARRRELARILVAWVARTLAAAFRVWLAYWHSGMRSELGRLGARLGRLSQYPTHMAARHCTSSSRRLAAWVFRNWLGYITTTEGWRARRGLHQSRRRTRRQLQVDLEPTLQCYMYSGTHCTATTVMRCQLTRRAPQLSPWMGDESSVDWPERPPPSDNDFASTVSLDSASTVSSGSVGGNP